jgi:hypothetical protein
MNTIKDMALFGLYPSSGKRAAPVLGYDVRRPFASEMEYFQQNPKVAGMAAEDGRITLNPFTGLDRPQQNAVALNEAYRLKMRDMNYQPQFSLTDQQTAAFRGTPYENNPDALKQSILARVLSGDKSAQATPEQMTIADLFRSMANR